MATKKHHRTKTKSNIGSYNTLIIIAAVVLSVIIGFTPQVRNWLSRPAPAAGIHIVTPPFAHLHPVAPGNTVVFQCTYLGAPCTDFTWGADPNAGKIGKYGGFTASSKLGTYKWGVRAEAKNASWTSYAKIVIANNFYPINLERTGTDDDGKFIFQPITLKWSANPGTTGYGDNVQYKVTYKYGWTGKPQPPVFEGDTSYVLPSDTIEYFADGNWFWTVSSIIDGITYDRPYPQYDASLKIYKKTATNFIIPTPDKCKSTPPYIIHKPQQVLSWEPIDSAPRYAIRIGIGSKSGPYWYAVSIIEAGINIIKPLYDLLPDHTYLYLSLSGTALPGEQNTNNLQYNGLSYGTVCPVYVDKDPE